MHLGTRCRGGAAGKPCGVVASATATPAVIHTLLRSCLLMDVETVHARPDSGAPSTCTRCAATGWFGSTCWSASETAMAACCTKLPPLTLFLSDQNGKEPLMGNACRQSMAQSAGAEGASGEDPAAPARVGAVLLPLLEPWRRPACGSCCGVVHKRRRPSQMAKIQACGVWWV
jgi:hypothetical protein